MSNYDRANMTNNKTYTINYLALKRKRVIQR
jgi:hypothetical protein